jgi:ferredoxin-NADP reductase
MARTAVLGRLTWQVATVVDVVTETPRVKTIAFDVPGWPGHRAGQHVDVRLTAEDGYEAQRSYSIASAPDGTRIELTIERLGDGEVSPYLTGELRPGDQIELRGPIGGYFVWEPSQNGPLLLVAGGSGVVPLMAMIRLRAAAGSDVDTRLLFSSRGWDDVIYREELGRLHSDGLRVVRTLTRSQPAGWTAYAQRVSVAARWPPLVRPSS